MRACLPSARTFTHLVPIRQHLQVMREGAVVDHLIVPLLVKQQAELREERVTGERERAGE